MSIERNVTKYALTSNFYILSHNNILTEEPLDCDKRMKRVLTILIIGLMFFTTFFVTFHDTTRGDEGSDVGRIYGYTYQTIGWETFPAPFTRIQAGDGHDISDIYGYYELKNLPLDEVYELKANKLGYEGVSVFVELTLEEPEVEINLLLTLKDTSQQKFLAQIHTLSPKLDALAIVNFEIQ